MPRNFPRHIIGGSRLDFPELRAAFRPAAGREKNSSVECLTLNAGRRGLGTAEAFADGGVRNIDRAERRNVLKLFTGKNEKRAAKGREAAL